MWKSMQVNKNFQTSAANHLEAILKKNFLDRVTHICISQLGHHGFRLRLVTWQAPSHYLNQCSIIVNWTLRNILQWKWMSNPNIFIKKKCIWKCRLQNGGHFVRPQCVNQCGQYISSTFWLFHVGGSFLYYSKIILNNSPCFVCQSLGYFL